MTRDSHHRQARQHTFTGLWPDRFYGLGVALIAGMLLAGSALAGKPSIEPDRAADLIRQGALVIDVRSAAEIEATGELADAETVVHTDVDGIRDVIGDDPDRPVVLYCGSGRRVALVMDELEQEGYRNLVNAGGYDDLHAALQRSAFPD